MAELLPINELPQYYPEAANMTENDQTKYLLRANAWAIGIIGGIPNYTVERPDTIVKTAVAMAFEIFSEGTEAETDNVNGNITEAAPAGHYVRSADDPLDVVKSMLLPYAAAFKIDNPDVVPPDNGFMFL